MHGRAKHDWDRERNTCSGLISRSLAFIAWSARRRGIGLRFFFNRSLAKKGRERLERWSSSPQPTKPRQIPSATSSRSGQAPQVGPGYVEGSRDNAETARQEYQVAAVEDSNSSRPDFEFTAKFLYSICALVKVSFWSLFAFFVGVNIFILPGVLSCGRPRSAEMVRLSPQKKRRIKAFLEEFPNCTRCDCPRHSFGISFK